MFDNYDVHEIFPNMTYDINKTSLSNSSHITRRLSPSNKYWLNIFNNRIAPNFDQLIKYIYIHFSHFQQPEVKAY